MRMTKMFTKTRKDAPADEVAKNAQLLIKAGFINKEMAGVYTYLPLGLKVLNNIVQVIREEMNALGGQEMLMTTLQKQEVWEASGRWSDDVIDVWFKTKLASGQDVGLATTHEEALTNLMKQYISSYKDLPTYPYQFQTKFRNELRSKSGIMRGREFLMKDLYSFSKDEAEFQAFYEESKKAYHKVFERVGLGEDTFLTFADGGSFSEFSHEFQTLTEAGEDTIYLSREKDVAVNKEVYRDDVLEKLGLNKDELEEVRAAEVGNIFPLGTKFSDAFNLKYTDENGELKPVIMGSYGIGPGRTMGVVVEKYADDKGLVWPEAIAPAKLHIVRIGSQEDVLSASDKLYEELVGSGVEVIYDDRDTQPGAMLADADLIGVPTRVVISSKSLAAGGAEVKARTDSEATIVALDKLATEYK
jgi:prolyl-tRNA synthetase